MKSGIYKIINTKSNKFYIGSSVRSVFKRWNDHLSQLRTQIHPNIHLQRAFNKDGEHSFVHEVLEFCLAKNCIEREQFWIDLLKPQYNINVLARSSYGTKRSEETRRKIGLSKLGNKNNVGRIWSKESCDKLSRSLKEAYDSGRVKPHGLKSTPEQKIKMGLTKIGNTNRRNNPTYKNIEQLDLDGNFIAFYNTPRQAAEALGKTGVAYRSIVLSCQTGKIRFNFRWRLKENVKLGELLEKPEAVNQQPSQPGMVGRFND